MPTTGPRTINTQTTTTRGGDKPTGMATGRPSDGLGPPKDALGSTIGPRLPAPTPSLDRLGHRAPRGPPGGPEFENATVVRPSQVTPSAQPPKYVADVNCHAEAAGRLIPNRGK